MSKMSEQQMLDKLRGFNTPSVGNVVASYPQHPHCLGLYDPWYGEWYTDDSLTCLLPGTGPAIGYAVTVVFGLDDPLQPAVPYLDFVDFLLASRKPSIVICEAQFPSEVMCKAGIFGGQSGALFKACGAVGLVTNSPVRDVDEIKAVGIQHLARGVTSGHGSLSLRAFNVPVTVAGMQVLPGDMIHMDENGACKFPADRLAEVCAHIDAFADEEKEHSDLLLSARDADSIKVAWKKVISKGVGLDDRSM
ncbi:MAG: RraA family protein [Chloroflexota bacterium]